MLNNMTSKTMSRIQNRNSCTTCKHSRRCSRKDINSKYLSPSRRKISNSRNRKRSTVRPRGCYGSRRRSKIKRSRSRKNKRISMRRNKSKVSDDMIPTEMHLTIPDKLINSDKIIPVELEVNSIKYFYPIIPSKLYLSNAQLSNGNKASVKINPRLICNTKNMATIVVPDSYNGDIADKSIVPFNQPESDPDKENESKIYALKLRKNETGATNPPLTIIIYENEEGEWVRLDSEGANLSPDNYITKELTKKDYDKGEVQLTAKNGDKITVPVKGDPPSENDPPTIITVTRKPDEKKNKHWSISDVVIGVALGGLAFVIGKFSFHGELFETFVSKPSKNAYKFLQNKFGKGDTKIAIPMDNISTSDKNEMEINRRKIVANEASEPGNPSQAAKAGVDEKLEKVYSLNNQEKHSFEALSQENPNVAESLGRTLNSKDLEPKVMGEFISSHFGF